jgi:hypothetical protein
MAVALHSYKIDKDRRIRVRHTFYAHTEEEADALMDAHAAGCKAFGPAVAAEQTIEIVEDIDELPDTAELELIAEDDEEDPEDDDDAEPEEEDEDAEEEQ